MENNFNYESVPVGYAHCFNDQCVRSEKCMRHLVAKQCTALHPTLYIVNPISIPEDTNVCSYFRPIRKVRMAWGIKRLLDNVPHKDAAPLKSQMVAFFGRNLYYSLYRKEKGLLPEQQEFIRQIFQSRGFLEEPTFDSYTEEYQWS